MYINLNDGTEVKFTSCGRGIEGAVFDAAAGEMTAASRKRGCDILVVHLIGAAGIPQFLCCARELDAEEIEEAQARYEQRKLEQDAANETLRETLLGPDGLKLVSDRQNGNRDGDTASGDICKALGLARPYSQNPRWSVVKDRIAELTQQIVAA